MSLDEDLYEEALRRRLPATFATPDVGQWHICTDFLDPLAEHFERIRKEWIDGDRDDQGLYDGIAAVMVWWMFAGHPENQRFPPEFHVHFPDIDFAIVWLSVHFSPGLASQLRRELRRALKTIPRHIKAIRMIWDIHNQSQPAEPERAAEFEALLADGDAEALEYFNEHPIQKITMPPLNDMIALDSHEKTIAGSLTRVCKYLRQLSVVLNSHELPAGPSKEDVRKSSTIEPSQERPPTEAEVERVRPFARANPHATREALQASLTAKYGQGLRDSTLGRVLDILRADGDYLVPAQEGKRKSNGRRKNSEE